MANIQTTKDVVALVNDPNKSNINMNVRPGHCSVQVRNEGVTHDVQLQPDEAINIGVALIQMAAACKSMMAQQAVQKSALGNGIVKSK